MIATLGPMFDELHGSFGGTTVRMTSHGVIISKKAHPLDRNSDRAMKTRAAMAKAREQWNDLSDDDQANWTSLRRTLVRTPSGKKLAGHSTRELYFSFVLPYLSFGASSPSTIPLASTTFRPFLSSASYQIGTNFNVAMDTDKFPVDTATCFLFGSRSFRELHREPTRFQMLGIFAELPGVPWNILTAYEAAFGEGKVGESILLIGICRENGTLPTTTTRKWALGYV